MSYLKKFYRYWIQHVKEAGEAKQVIAERLTILVFFLAAVGARSGVFPGIWSEQVYAPFVEWAVLILSGVYFLWLPVRKDEERETEINSLKEQIESELEISGVEAEIREGRSCHCDVRIMVRGSKAAENVRVELINVDHNLAVRHSNIPGFLTPDVLPQSSINAGDHLDKILFQASVYKDTPLIENRLPIPNKVSASIITNRGHGAYLVYELDRDYKVIMTVTAKDFRPLQNIPLNLRFSSEKAVCIYTLTRIPDDPKRS